jgi:uncharacterized protein YggE
MQRDSTLLIAALAMVALVGVGAFAAFGTAGAQEDVQTTNNTGDAPDRTIQVSATGGADAAPDQGAANVAVTAEGETVGEVRDELATGTQRLTAALDDLGVEYETSDYSVDESGRRTASDYEGSHEFVVRFDDPEMAGEVVDAVAGAGAEVEDVRLTLSEETRESLREEAIQNAMADARQQADTIADSGDLAVAGVQSVDASQRSYRPVRFTALDAEAGQDGAAPPTEIESGDVSVSYSVDVTYNANDA